MRLVLLLIQYISVSIFWLECTPAMHIEKNLLIVNHKKTSAIHGGGELFLERQQNATDTLFRKNLYIERIMYTYIPCKLVVIIGCSCSGKSFLEKQLSRYFGDSAYVFPEGPYFWSVIDKILQAGGTKQDIIPTFSKDMNELIRGRDGSSYFQNLFQAECYSKFEKRQAERIIEKYQKVPIEFFVDVTAQLIIDGSKGKEIVITTHEHTYEDFLLLTRALEYNFFRMPTYPVFMYVSPEKFAERLRMRNQKVLKQQLPYYDLRLNARLFTEFFQNLKPADSGQILDSLNLERMYAVLDQVFLDTFPMTALKLKEQYPELASYNFEAFLQQIHSKARKIVDGFFEFEKSMDVTFVGKGCCFTSDEEIKKFIEHLL